MRRTYQENGVGKPAFTLCRLNAVSPDELISLHNDSRVLRHLPLADAPFGEAECHRWLAEKESQWQAHGYGPWSIHVAGDFAGWGGFQYEQGDADLGLVLAAAYWGMGGAICRTMLCIGFEDEPFDSVTALLPPGRVKVKGMQRLGFERDGQIRIGSVLFHRYRCWAPGVIVNQRNGE